MHRQSLGDGGGQAALLQGPCVSSASGVKFINRGSGLALWREECLPYTSNMYSINICGINE